MPVDACHDVDFAGQALAVDCCSSTPLPGMADTAGTNILPQFWVRLESMTATPTGRGDLPAYHVPFVGRDTELATLRIALEQAEAGRGQIVLLVGEPGIGKTRTATVIAGEAEAAGAEVLWGSCYEWEGAPPYWPWLQALRSLGDSLADDTLRALLGSNASIIRQVLPELGDRFPELQPPPTMQPEQARFQLFQAIAGFLGAVSANLPLVIVLDDLQWSDTSSLLLLLFVAQNIRQARVLIVGTYRDVEIDREHPLAGTLAELSREHHVQRLHLGGLSDDDVRRFIRQTTGQPPSDALVSTIYAETEGNPFFIGEVVRLLASEGRLADAGAAPLRRVPESVRGVIRRRLDRLTAEDNRILSIAAIAGRVFSVHMLAEITTSDIDALLDTLDTAVQARLVEPYDAPGQYRFAHALVQETLYDDLSTAARMRVHGEIAAAIERRYQGDLAPSYPELAYHYSRAAAVGSGEQAVEYAIRAAEQAAAGVAWETAIGYYQMALRALDTHVSATERQRCEILLALGEAQSRAGAGAGQVIGAGNSVETTATFMEAARVARAAGLVEHFARAAHGIVGPSLSVAQGFNEASQLMRDALESLPRSDNELYASLLAGYAAHRSTLMAIDKEAWDQATYVDLQSSADEAVAIARRLGDPATLSYTLHARAHVNFGPHRIELVQQDADEAVATALRAADPRLRVMGLFTAYQAALYRGDVDAARQTIDPLLRTVAPLKVRYFDYVGSISAAGQAYRDGRFADAERHINAALESWPGGGIATWELLALRYEQNRAHEVAGAVRWIFEQGPSTRMWRVMWIRALVEIERQDEARALFDAIPEADLLRVTPHWFLRLCALYAELCDRFGDTRRAAFVYDQLQPFAHHNVFAANSDHVCGSASHYLGILATTLGRWDDADRHFAAALEANECWRIRPAIAWTRYAWAEMLVRSGDFDRERVASLLDAALADAQPIGMTRLATHARALASQPILQEATGRHDTEANGLSPREVEVLRLIAAGQVDKEIAEALSISPRTVTTHVTHILNKLGASTRTEAAIIALRTGIL